uniref:Glucose-methanol-choline oxidoreductase N-terminal domain-containing protein n=1 Tax=Arion vulgaris TaxID=1028688 RepID=A0A0B7BEN7_9EUPU
MSTAVNVGLVVLAAIVLRYVVYPDEPTPPRLAVKLNASYDYIVVGSGSAGSVIASRLSEDKDVTVLLLEAGEFDGNRPQVYIPGLALLNLRSDFDWWYMAEPKNGVMTGLKDGRSYWPRGKVLGGSSSLNAMQYVRASRHDYDRWSEYTKDEGWSYQHLLPYFKKSEDINIPGLKSSQYHGHGGPFTINHLKSKPLSAKIIEAGQAAGYSYNEDYNGRTMEGICNSQVNTNNDERMSTGRAFIHPALGRPNLDVSVKSHVKKINIQNKKAVGVEVIKDGRKYVVNARKEIILSAGAVNSPQILMLSGIGPKKHLESLNIPVVADLPVGQNLQDHLWFDMGVRIREHLTSTWPGLRTFWSELQFKLFGTGPLNSPFSLEVLAFKSTTKETREKDWPDLQIHFIEIMPNDILMDIFNYNEETKAELKDRNRGDYGFTCLPSIMRPESIGNISLRSNDPFDYPLIYPNYLDRQEDIDILIRGIRECQKIVGSKPLQDIGAEFTEKGPESVCKQHKFDSNQYWECLVKHRALTIYHPIGTCKMGPKGDKTAVVDTELRVQGISGLRVADASIMPWLVSGNTNAPSIMIGEKAADLIKGKKLEPSNV